MRSSGAGFRRAVEPSRQRLVERVDEERRFAAAGNAGDAGEESERNLGGDVLQIVAARADELQPAVSGCGRRSGMAISRAPTRYWPVSELRMAHDVGGRAFGDDLAAMDAGAGADIDHIVGGADRVLVVLDHDHGVAEVAQPFQRFEEPRIVALMQPDRGLVEHVEHAGQAGADLRGQPDALAFAAGKRAARRAPASDNRARHRSGISAARGSP